MIFNQDGFYRSIIEHSMRQHKNYFRKNFVVNYLEHENLFHYNGIVQKIISASNKEILMSELKKEIQEIAGVSEKRAALIGADQVGKLNGRLVQYRQTSAGIESYIWRTMGDNRVRPKHRARAGVIYKWSNPPEGGHPGQAVRCRCVAQPLIDESSFKLVPQKNSYTNINESDKISTKTNSEEMKLLQNELAVIHDNGNRNKYTVNFELMNSKAYHDKFENLSAIKQVNEGLYRQSTKILSHRSGTEYEDIAMIDARTGKLLVENNSAFGIYKFQSGLTAEQYFKLQNSGKKFEILHNHPSSSIPSTADIIGLFKRKNAVASTVICHDGTIYRIEKLRHFDDIDQLVTNIYNGVKHNFAGFPNSKIEYQTSRILIETLSSEKIIIFKEV